MHNANQAPRTGREGQMITARIDHPSRPKMDRIEQPVMSCCNDGALTFDGPISKSRSPCANDHVLSSSLSAAIEILPESDTPLPLASVIIPRLCRRD